MSGAIFNDDTGYPAPQALREGFKARYIVPEIMPASTRCWHISLPDDPQVTAAMHEILGILRGEAVWSGDNATPMAALISNMLNPKEITCEPMTNHLKFAGIGSGTVIGTTAVNFLDMPTIVGSPFFPANYPYQLGDTFVFTSWLSATSNMNRVLTINPRTLGQSNAQFSITIPADETIRIEVITRCSIADLHIEGGKLLARTNVVERLLVHRDFRELQIHHFDVWEYDELDTTIEQEYRLVVQLETLSGATSAVSLEQTSLEIQRVYEPSP